MSSIPSLLLGSLCLLLGLGVVAALVSVAVASSRRAKERTQGLVGYAAHREWTYLGEDPRLVDRFPGAPFGRGSRRQATSVLHGTYEGRAITAFDYSYVTSGGADQADTTSRYSVVATSLGVRVPSLSVSPQGGLGRLLGNIFGEDLQVGDPVFDDRFRVSADDPRFARDVLHPGMTELLMQWPDLSWRLSLDSLVLFRPGRHEPAEIEAKLAMTVRILAQVPEQVWANLRAGEG